MIDKSEIMTFSKKFGLRANVVEKDYVLGWLLSGIHNHNQIKDDWVFKGGTCLKKCYINTYRFSEDLDFTLVKGATLEPEFLIQCFREIAEWIYDATGIEIPENLIRFDVYENHREGISAQGRLGYRGPLQPGGDLPRIKLDLTLDEILVMKPVIQKVDHPYSDHPDEGIFINGYTFEEVFAEKIRALVERERPRDLYDVVCLFKQHQLTFKRKLIVDVLEKKCIFKGIDFPSMAMLKNRDERQELEAEWENMLAHQMADLPEFELFWNETETIMEWLNKGKK